MNKRNIFISFFVFFLIILAVFFYINFLNKKREIIVIVRSVGERTEEKCVKNLQNIFGKENVYLIKNVTPLIKATKKAINLAIKKNAKWTLFVDADVFISKDETFLFIEKADEIIKNVDDKAFVFQGLLFDKFPQEYRHSGFWLYKTDKLPLMERYYDFCSSKLKPDDCLVSSVVLEGKHSYAIEHIVGIHDFFQTNESIVKKYFLRAEKLPDKIENWKTKWSDLAKNDKDFYWALKGVELYQNCNESEKFQNQNFLNEFIKKSGLQFEKQEELQDSDIYNVLNKYVENSDYKIDKIKFYQSRLEKREMI